jgi:hypothetical protein
VLGSRIEAQFISFLLNCSMSPVWRQRADFPIDY